LLQTCPTLEEAYKVIGEISSQLFNHEAGGFYIINSSRNLVEQVAAWGPPLPDSSAFEPNDCWGLRLGRLHVMDKGRMKNGHSVDTLTLLCNHIHAPGPDAYLCVPLVAQGEALGLLHLRCLSNKAGQVSKPDEVDEWFTESKQQFARSTAYRVALALANLRLRETLRQQSIRDPLTGLFNRRYMEESLERELRRVIRNQRPLGIIMMDIDHFKQYNDIYGHEIGDIVLRKLGALLRSNTRVEDIACRYGGEEFVLIMPDASLEVTGKRAEKLCEDVKHLDIKSSDMHMSSVTLSLGVAAYPDQGSTADAILKAADAALYRAKRVGRGRVELAESLSGKAEIDNEPEKKPKGNHRQKQE
jgi:diguanylate cyclase (GGDEF)-like protein